MSKKYQPTTSDVMATALVDVLHAAALAALLRDGDDLTMAEIKALAAGTTALADTAAQHLTKHLDTIIIASAKGVAA